jgi:epoxide hydrolase-like predicted phosphatase
MQILVFDMGHVFIDFEWQDVCNGFCAKSGKTLDDLRRVMGEVSKLGYESGKIDTAGFLSELNRHLGIELTREEFTKLWTHTFRENAEMAVLLQKLRAQRPLYLLSNTNEVHYEWLQSTFDVERHFDELILSYKVGCSKPEAEIYREVLRRGNRPAEDFLFVDDLECNIKAAAALGMHTIQFAGVDDLRKMLSGLGFTV